MLQEYKNNISEGGSGELFRYVELDMQGMCKGDTRLLAK
jgi:hypothetical protein